MLGGKLASAVLFSLLLASTLVLVPLANIDKVYAPASLSQGKRIGFWMQITTTSNIYSADTFFNAYFLTPPYPAFLEMMIGNAGHIQGSTPWVDQLATLADPYPNIEMAYMLAWDLGNEAEWTIFENFVEMTRNHPSIAMVGVEGEYMGPTLDQMERIRAIVEARGKLFVSYYIHGQFGPDFLEIGHANFPEGRESTLDWFTTYPPYIGISSGFYNTRYFPEDRALPEDPTEIPPPGYGWNQEVVNTIIEHAVQYDDTVRHAVVLCVGFSGLPTNYFTGVSGQTTNKLWDNPTLRDWISQAMITYPSNWVTSTGQQPDAGTTYSVSIDPNNGRIYVDDSPITSLTTYSWVEGSTHTLDPDSDYSPSSGTRLLFSEWSDGNSEDPRTVTVTADASFVAQWTTQHYLTVNSPYGSPSGQGWYDSGSTVTSSVTSPTNEGVGTRYVADGSYLDGVNFVSGPSRSVTMNAPHTISWVWHTEYYVDASVNPSGAGSVGGEGWYTSGTTATLTATANAGYEFASWSGDVSSTNNPVSIAVDGPKSIIANFDAITTTYTVTINPNGGRIYVDGSPIMIQTDYNWIAGSTHTINPDSGYSPSVGTRLMFTQWSDGSTEDPRSITVNSAASYTAQWRAQYQLTVNSPYDSPIGAGWYDSGSTVTSSVTSPTNEGVGTRYVADGSYLDGVNFVSGPSRSVTMNAPHTISWVWHTEYYVDASVNPSGAGSVSGAGWYTSQATAELTAVPNSGYEFANWSGDLLSSNNSVSFPVDGPRSVTANVIAITTEYSVSINPNGGRVYVDGSLITTATNYIWASGSTHTIDPDSGYSPSSGTRLLFTQWSDGDTSDPRTITVSGMMTFTAQWTTQYYLTVNSPHGSPTGRGWHDSGSTATSSVTSPESGEPGIRYMAIGSYLDGTALVNGTSRSITMDAPHAIDWQWKVQYQLAISITPEGGETTPPSVGVYWYDSGSLAIISEVPNADYDFSHWNLDGRKVGTGKSYTIIMNAPHTLQAVFEPSSSNKHSSHKVTTRHVAQDPKNLSATNIFGITDPQGLFPVMVIIQFAIVGTAITIARRRSKIEKR